jgi:hypothetical protein
MGAATKFEALIVVIPTLTRTLGWEQVSCLTRTDAASGPFLKSTASFRLERAGCEDFPIQRDMFRGCVRTQRIAGLPSILAPIRHYSSGDSETVPAKTIVTVRGCAIRLRF